MPCTARFVNRLTSPSHIWPPAWSGADDKALVNFASAAVKVAAGSVTKEFTPSIASTPANQMSASTLSGSALSARSKVRALAPFVGDQSLY